MIGPKSARSTAPYQIEASASTSTSPTSVAVGAIHADGSTRGDFPSNENSGIRPSSTWLPGPGPPRPWPWPRPGPVWRDDGRCWDAWGMTAGARVEHVGSLLRPGYLRAARDGYAGGEVTPAEFKAAQDRAVREVVAMQTEVGLPVVNDGELRRDSFQSELTAACDGFSGVSLDAWLWGAWHSAQVGDATVPR